MKEVTIGWIYTANGRNNTHLRKIGGETSGKEIAF
jgi:hypothetical protein